MHDRPLPRSLACTLRTLLIASVLCLSTSPALAQQALPEPSSSWVYKQTTDAAGQAVQLKLHMFKPEGWSKDDKRPAVVFFFGGGWVSGKPSHFYGQCNDLAAKGMVAISAEYRIFSKHKTPPQACVEDGKSAVRYVRAHAAGLGIDPDRIASAGGSAGGHVAASAGILTGYDGEGEELAISSKPNLMILFNPVIDTSAETGYGAKKVGKDPLSLCPLHNANKDQPPSLILHGDADTTVKIDSVRRFKKRCDQLGVACEVREYAGASHGFFNHPGYRKPKPNAPDYYSMTLSEACAFLQKHGYLKPAEKK